MSRWTPQIEEEIADGERWLAGFVTPSVREGMIQRLKQKTRDELHRRQIDQRRKSWAPWHGAAAAAAVLLLCVGLGWYSTQWQAPVTNLYVQNDLDEMVADTIDPNFERLSAIEKELSAIESISSDYAWALNGTTFYDAMNEAVSDDRANGMDNTGAFIRSKAWSHCI